VRRGRLSGEGWILLAGDIVAIAIVTLIGFARHGELETAGLRPLTTFLPFSLTWLLLSPFFGVYRPEKILSPSGFWRPATAAILAAPFAAMLRGLILSSPVQPVFVLVLGLTEALGILIWRAVFIFLLRSRPRASDG
jgi:Protein of unknown function (DUF3054)